MKAIINDDIIIPFSQIQEGFFNEHIVNGITSYTYSIVLRIPNSSKFFNILKNLQENKTKINKLEYFNDMDESIGTITIPLQLKELYRALNDNVNIIMAKFYPADEENNE